MRADLPLPSGQLKPSKRRWQRRCSAALLIGPQRDRSASRRPNSQPAEQQASAGQSAYPRSDQHDAVSSQHDRQPQLPAASTEHLRLRGGSWRGTE